MCCATWSEPAVSVCPRAWLFDCDGTLVDSEEPGLEVLHALALEDGLSLGLDEARLRFIGSLDELAPLAR